jgi:hypothetical protein
MDKTPQYIRMADEAEEIQRLRKSLNLWFEGDRFAQRNHSGKWYVTLATTNGRRHGRSIFFRAKDSVWLPDQAQLQRMFGYRNAIELLDGLYGLVREYTQEAIDYYEQFTTMEQLWLAFVMKEKYDKIWNGKEWLTG